MTDEEKKAIEYWKTHMKILHWNTQLASEHYIKVLLDLIEKQQKEIEELKEECKEVVCVPEGTCFMLEPKDVDKKWKDKIKAKIKELEKGNKNTFIRGEKILVLQSLLEKE